MQTVGLSIQVKNLIEKPINWFKKPTMEQYAWAAGLCFVATVLIVLFIASGPASFGEWVTRVVAIASVAVSILTRRQSKRSADAAEQNAALASAEERRRRHKLVLEPHPIPYRHVLRNAGTVTATNVNIANRGDFAHAEFVGADGPVTIPAGQSYPVDLVTSWGGVGTRAAFEWIPEGESGKKTWTEALYPSASEIADRGKDQEYKDAREAREKDLDRETRRELRSLILQLGDAYAQYKANPDTPGNRLRVQLLTAALPPGIAREIGYEVDVPRDVWGENEHPFLQHIDTTDAHLIEDVLPELELVWNMRQVEGTEVYGPTEAPGPNSEPRIWWAVQGYVSRIKDRQAGVRHYRDSPRDQQSKAKAMAHMQGIKPGLKAEVSTEAGTITESQSDGENV